MIDPNTTKTTQIDAAIELLRSHVSAPQMTDHTNNKNDRRAYVTLNFGNSKALLEDAKGILRILQAYNIKILGVEDPVQQNT